MVNPTGNIETVKKKKKKDSFAAGGLFLFVIYTLWNESSLVVANCKTPLNEIGSMIYAAVQGPV